MIRINLYQSGPKPKKTKRGSAPVVTSSGGGEGIALFLMLAVVLVPVVLGNAAWYWKLNADSQRIKTEMRKAELEAARLKEVKLRYLEREKQKDLYKKRIDVIDSLRASQSGPVTLLATLADTVNRTDQVWLSSMSDDGTKITLKGMALSIHGVADLMHNLEKTGIFKAVDFTSSQQDEQTKDMQAFVFELVCYRAGAQAETAQPKKS
jgi:Tfp pilus assembly protein PilN